MSLKITIDHNIPEVKAAMTRASRQVPFALANAINATALEARAMVQASMRTAFDRPTPWVINSLRVVFAKKTNLQAEVAFKDKNSAESSRSMLEPQVLGGQRRFKGMEIRLQRRGLMPSSYNVVPGAGAALDAFGNMSRGQISQLLNVLGTYTEAGYNKANDKTRQKLAKGNIKKNQYGFEYFIAPVGKSRHLKPGVYKRFKTGFGSSLKPILLFVPRVKYTQRLDFFGAIEAKARERLAPNFNAAFEKALSTAFLKVQGDLL